MASDSTGRDSRGRFTKGQSPNPKGRPKKAPDTVDSCLGVVFDRLVTAKGPDGTRKVMSADEAVEHRVYQDAMEGKARAINRVIGWIQNRQKWRIKEADRRSPRAVPSQKFVTDPENAVEALTLLGIATDNHPYNEAGSERVWRLLEPWAVEAALRRRRSEEPFDDKAVAEIERCTRDPKNLRWPRASRR